MKIVELRRQRGNKNRFNVYGEDGFICSLWDETIVKNSIKEGTDVPDDVMEVMKKEDTLKYAKELSFKYMTYAPRTEKQLVKKLEGAGIDDSSISAAVALMKEYGYINDAAYAAEYAKSYLKKYSPKVVEYRLINEGVDKKTASEAVAAENGDENLRALYEKYAKKYSALEPALKKRRISEALARRGFSWQDMEELFSGDFQEDEE